jgi:hypothetical protein
MIFQPVVLLMRPRILLLDRACMHSTAAEPN